MGENNQGFGESVDEKGLRGNLILLIGVLKYRKMFATKESLPQLSAGGSRLQS
jgi:hypothetical protein